MMVVGTENCNTGASRYMDAANDGDTVDLFEMPGRPLTVRRV
jgi:hypothetical protein